jgi:hypothetical protein
MGADQFLNQHESFRDMKGNEEEERMKRAWIAALALAAILTVGPAYAGLANFGFETGSTAGWGLDLNIGASNVTGNFTDPYVTYPFNFGPVEGSNFMVLTAGWGDVPVTARQTFTAVSGEIIQGKTAFASGELYDPSSGFGWFNDKSWVKIFDDNNSQYLYTAYAMDVATAGLAGYTNWALWTWTAPYNGTFVVEYGVQNYADFGGASSALYDAAPVPLPPSLLLLAPGLIGILGLRRRLSR